LQDHLLSVAFACAILQRSHLQFLFFHL